MTAVLAGALASTPAVQAAEDPDCAAGVRFTSDHGEAATGLRVLSVEVTNCGAEPLQLNGYPQVSLFDRDYLPLDVEVVDGARGVSIMPGFSDPPQPITVLPGETAATEFVWHNWKTTLDPSQVADHVELATSPGATRQPLVALPPLGNIHLDFGTTGKLGVRAWYR
ncbi:DUF4232 domain-containing protein [Lentzea sp. NPDC060358]|uniref:DUF4232 domain-containing protein n=1 Tax=Lentzea sp. NPDC060358 TaxID=3347103 RepID=UPI0036551E6E